MLRRHPMLLRLLALATAVCQHTGQGSDGNPHNWDRRRRCDNVDYSPACGVCEGYGGIPHGDRNEEITLTSCRPLAASAAPIRPVWSARMTMSPYYAVQIGPKQDPFCFQAIPGNSSVGPLCYQRQTGSQVYDMSSYHSLRFDVNLATNVGNVTSGVIAHDKYLWIVNHLPWYAFGVKQCICTSPREGGDAAAAAVYPLSLDWVDNLRYVGKERVGIEYVGGTRDLEHWAFGPHHVWSEPATGSIIRMWQPYNGLQVMPNGTLPSAIDPALFAVPPVECTSESKFTFKIKCNASGYPEAPASPSTTASSSAAATASSTAAAASAASSGSTDPYAWRAVERVPRPEYKGATFDAMSATLSQWLQRGAAATRPCEEWAVEELQQLQAQLYLLRHAEYDAVYTAANDSRALGASLDALQADWAGLNAAAAASGLDEMHRDGHCHEAAMWWVHHLTEDARAVLRQRGVVVPLLSPLRHACPEEAAAAEEEQVCAAYQYKVSCASCHSAPVDPSAEAPPMSLPRLLELFR